MTTTDLVPVDVDRAKVLLAFGLNVRDPNAQAALLVCQRYDLDPLLKHVQLIKQAVYVTRDGYLHVAHKSGAFDGMELVDEGETDTYYWAKVSVYRKDMTRPFTAKARCRKDERVFGDPWDMAITRAERRALKRAFNVAGLPSEGDWDEHEELYDRDTGAAVTEPAAELERPQFEDPPLPDDSLAVPVEASEVQRSEAPGEGAAVVPPAAASDPGRMTTPQQNKLFALLNGAKIDDRHAYASGVLGRPVESYTDLSKDDATMLIDDLKRLASKAS